MEFTSIIGYIKGCFTLNQAMVLIRLCVGDLWLILVETGVFDDYSMSF